MTAKDLIMGNINEAPADDDMSPDERQYREMQQARQQRGFPDETPLEAGMRRPLPRRPGGPGRMRGPGGPGLGMDDMDEPPGMMTRAERDSFKDLVLLDLWHAAGGDEFTGALVKAAMDGTDPSPSQIQHLLDEGSRYADKMPPRVHALMGKLASLPPPKV